MLTKKRLFVIWCVLICAIIWIAFLPVDSSIHRFAVQYDSNRWLRFLVYASISAIPVSSWKSRITLVTSLLIPVLGMCIELWQTHVQASSGLSMNITPDLFGVAAGVLFGMNIRVMRKSALKSRDLGSGSSGPFAN
jgi:hypothetical protein